jgi:hypothetical protein
VAVWFFWRKLNTILSPGLAVTESGVYFRIPTPPTTTGMSTARVTGMAAKASKAAVEEKRVENMVKSDDLRLG